MATAKPAKSRRPGIILAGVAILLLGTAWYFRAPMTGYAGVSTAYAARVACSCRHAGGRDLEDCAKDKLAGMELVTLTEDAEAKSVTARFPLISSDTASWREGYGCVLEPWED
ncbi:hypothetical protein U4960_02600 [Altererythrobacter sp. H2]|uniref:hypothetical protein n=1 Tax=Altererythrobacter sp. H2 TaxID=3108391 RepID=UPI002B4BD1A7|nr:hypothetical protein [Altererythrobacter sp. H2]WRK96241.1 hypothetical protein U4960_02600 [Altererythrobacter sp. H2]